MPVMCRPRAADDLRADIGKNVANAVAVEDLEIDAGFRGRRGGDRRKLASPFIEIGFIEGNIDPADLAIAHIDAGFLFETVGETRPEIGGTTGPAGIGERIARDAPRTLSHRRIEARRSLHPGAGGNPAFGTQDLDNTMRMVFYPAVIGWTLLGFWMGNLSHRMGRIRLKLMDAL